MMSSKKFIVIFSLLVGSLTSIGIWFFVDLVIDMSSWVPAVRGFTRYGLTSLSGLTIFVLSYFSLGQTSKDEEKIERRDRAHDVK